MLEEKWESTRFSLLLLPLLSRRGRHLGLWLTGTLSRTCCIGKGAKSGHDSKAKKERERKRVAFSCVFFFFFFSFFIVLVRTIVVHKETELQNSCFFITRLSLNPNSEYCTSTPNLCLTSWPFITRSSLSFSRSLSFSLKHTRTHTDGSLES